jgi:hypothetical protein
MSEMEILRQLEWTPVRDYQPNRTGKENQTPGKGLVAES